MYRWRWPTLPWFTDSFQIIWKCFLVVKNRRGPRALACGFTPKGRVITLIFVGNPMGVIAGYCQTWRTCRRVGVTGRRRLGRPWWWRRWVQISIRVPLTLLNFTGLIRRQIQRRSPGCRRLTRWRPLLRTMTRRCWRTPNFCWTGLEPGRGLRVKSRPRWFQKSNRVKLLITCFRVDGRVTVKPPQSRFVGRFAARLTVSPTMN